MRPPHSRSGQIWKPAAKSAPASAGLAAEARLRGTAVTLAEAGLAVTKVEDVTGFPELLDGRVKTLHPRIHAGVLARRGRKEDLVALAEHGIEPFDLVCVNLYPFELAVDRPELDEADLIEMIDVGGPALLDPTATSTLSIDDLRPIGESQVLAEGAAERALLGPRTTAAAAPPGPRDAREVERKKPGRKGARASFQFSKR